MTHLKIKIVGNFDETWYLGFLGVADNEDGKFQ